MAIDWLQPAITGVVAVVGVAGTLVAARQARDAQVRVAELTKDAQLQVAALTRQTQVDVAAVARKSQLDVTLLGNIHALTAEKRPLYATYLRLLNEAGDAAQEYRKSADLINDTQMAEAAESDQNLATAREQTRNRAGEMHQRSEKYLAELRDLQFQITVVGGPALGQLSYSGTTAVSMHAIGRITDDAMRGVAISIAVAMHADINPAVANKKEAIEASLQRVVELGVDPGNLEDSVGST